MPAKRVFSNVNLTPKDEFDSSVVGKSLKWALTAGKSIVILTEFVVILAFLSRFKLDRDLNDLNEEIGQKQLVVDSFSEVETQMRAIQSKLKVIRKGTEGTVGVKEYVTYLSSIMPRDVTLESMDMTVDKLSLSGQSISESGFARLINELSRSEKYDSVDVGKTEFNPRAGAVIFEVTAIDKKTVTTNKSGGKEVKK